MDGAKKKFHVSFPWWRYFGDGLIQTTVAKILIFQVAQQFLRIARKVLELMVPYSRAWPDLERQTPKLPRTSQPGVSVGEQWRP